MRTNGLIFLMLLILAFTVVMLVACDDSDDSEAAGLKSADDDDGVADDDVADDDDDDNGEVLGSNSCGTYTTTGCDATDQRECDSADLCNEARLEYPEESACAPSLQWSDDLAEVARAHSKDMCDRNFFDHKNPDGDDPFDRITDAGIEWYAAGENIAYGTNLSASQAHELFMDEPVCEQNHRSNILSWLFTHVGVGMYDCGANVYLTQNFATFEYGDLPAGEHPYCGPGF